MDFQQLRFAVTLAETLNFRRAAEHEHITQSTFSGRIARLERELGARLFERDSHHVGLTPAGELFIAQARRTLAEMQTAALEINQLHRGYTGRLRIGVFAEGAAELTPTLIRAFRELAPRVQLYIVELSFAAQVSAITEDRVDVAFVRPPLSDRRVELLPLFCEPRSAAVPSTHPLSAASSLSIRDLLDEPVVRASGPEHWGSFWSFDEERGEPGRWAATTHSVAESLASVAHLGAVDSAPASAARHFTYPGVSYVPLRDARPALVALARLGRVNRPVVQAFCEIAVRLTAEHLKAVPMASLPSIAEPR